MDDEAQAVDAAAQTFSLGRWAGDHAGLIVFGLVVFMVVLRLRLRRRASRKGRAYQLASQAEPEA